MDFGNRLVAYFFTLSTVLSVGLGYGLGLNKNIRNQEFKYEFNNVSSRIRTNMINSRLARRAFDKDYARTLELLNRTLQEVFPNDPEKAAAMREELDIFE